MVTILGDIYFWGDGRSRRPFLKIGGLAVGGLPKPGPADARTPRAGRSTLAVQFCAGRPEF